MESSNSEMLRARLAKSKTLQDLQNLLKEAQATEAAAHAAYDKELNNVTLFSGEEGQHYRQLLGPVGMHTFLMVKVEKDAVMFTEILTRTFEGLLDLADAFPANEMAIDTLEQQLDKQKEAVGALVPTDAGNAAGLSQYKAAIAAAEADIKTLKASMPGNNVREALKAKMKHVADRLSTRSSIDGDQIVTNAMTQQDKLPVTVDNSMPQVDDDSISVKTLSPASDFGDQASSSSVVADEPPKDMETEELQTKIESVIQHLKALEKTKASLDFVVGAGKGYVGMDKVARKDLGVPLGTIADVIDSSAAIFESR